MTDLNIPLSGIAALLVVSFLRLKTPGGSTTEKLRRIDWMYANSFQPLTLKLRLFRHMRTKLLAFVLLAFDV